MTVQGDLWTSGCGYLGRAFFNLNGSSNVFNGEFHNDRGSYMVIDDAAVDNKFQLLQNGGTTGDTSQAFLYINSRVDVDTLKNVGSYLTIDGTATLNAEGEIEGIQIRHFVNNGGITDIMNDNRGMTFRESMEILGGSVTIDSELVLSCREDKLSF